LILKDFGLFLARVGSYWSTLVSPSKSLFSSLQIVYRPTACQRGPLGLKRISAVKLI